MYRAVIEHPQFMPSELQKRADMRLGDDRGRIYRIVRRDMANNVSPAGVVPGDFGRTGRTAATRKRLVAGNGCATAV